MNQDEYQKQIDDFDKKQQDLKLNYQKKRTDNEIQYNQKRQAINELLELNQQNQSDYNLTSHQIIDRFEESKNKLDNPISTQANLLINQAFEQHQNNLNTYQRTEDTLNQELIELKRTFEKQDEEFQNQYLKELHTLDNQINDLKEEFY